MPSDLANNWEEYVWGVAWFFKSLDIMRMDLEEFIFWLRGMTYMYKISNED